MGNVFKISKVTKRVSISTKETKNSKTVKYGAVTALKDHMLRDNKVSRIESLVIFVVQNVIVVLSI